MSRWQSFTKASEVLNISQPSLSQHVTKLETKIGKKIIDRTTRHFKLTEFGEVFVERANKLIAEMDSFQDFVESYDATVKGKLVVGIIPVVGYLRMGDMMSEFHNKYPDVNLIISEGLSHPLISGLKDTDSHVTIATPNSKELHESYLAHELLIDDELVVIVANEHPLAKHSGPLSLGDLANQKMVLPQKDTGAYTIICKALEDVGIDPRNYSECSLLDLKMNMVRYQEFVGFFPKKSVKYFSDGVTVIDLENPPKKPLMLSSLKRNSHYPPLKAFKTFAHEWVQKHID
ncbi:LysR family transcriptional regulator [Zophobihabitans entericus]|uniref:LysR family transcriptional regulator n=1 Tax=Zophobihabitans entericus TaxID=1635327 RepID=A0A6G9IAT9_9GAMM|nr:LysR family transcriptional regulator [Zophobihabitans entericus]